MTRGPERIVEEWLTVAREDWSRVKLLLSARDARGAGVSLQQSLEKFLKAFLIARSWQLRKIHTLGPLLDEAAQHNLELARFRDLCDRVTTYFVTWRYPPLSSPIDENQVRADFEEAKSLILALFPHEQL